MSWQRGHSKLLLANRARRAHGRRVILSFLQIHLTRHEEFPQSSCLPANRHKRKHTNSNWRRHSAASVGVAALFPELVAPISLALLKISLRVPQCFARAKREREREGMELARVRSVNHELVWPDKRAFHRVCSTPLRATIGSLETKTNFSAFRSPTANENNLSNLIKPFLSLAPLWPHISAKSLIARRAKGNRCRRLFMGVFLF